MFQAGEGLEYTKRKETEDTNEGWNSMIGQPVALLQIPSQRAFKTKAAARYLGMHPQTLRKYVDEGKIQAKREGSQRVFLLEEMDRFIEGLPQWTFSKE